MSVLTHPSRVRSLLGLSAVLIAAVVGGWLLGTRHHHAAPLRPVPPRTATVHVGSLQSAPQIPGSGSGG